MRLLCDLHVGAEYSQAVGCTQEDMPAKEASRLAAHKVTRTVCSFTCNRHMGMLLTETCTSLLQLCSRQKRYLCEMWREAVVWSGLYGQSNAPGAALLTELDCLLNIAGGMARQGVMQVAHEVVSVVQRQRHEGATHQNELHLKQEQPCDCTRTAAFALSCCEQSCQQQVVLAGCMCP